MTAGRDEHDVLLREHGLLLRILELGHCPDVEPFLKDTLRLLVEVANAKRAYLEVFDPAGGEPDLAWTTSEGCSEDDLASIQAGVSRSIIERSLRDGEMMRTICARDDARFSDRSSVKQGNVEAVLCTGIGEPPVGVIYLEGERGQGGFDDEAARMVALVARHAAPFVPGLAARRRFESMTDHTAAWRERLKIDGIVGRSRALAGVLKTIDTIARFRTSVLITGPSGSGKTALARALAINSHRALAPFVHVNCGQIPEGLIATELFGAEAGAYTGAAAHARTGKVEEADGGTLFLDEVTTLPVSAQAALLQFLDNGEFARVGDPKTYRADVRLIAATNADIREEIAAGRFREDLYYRLAEVTVAIPPLAERIDDIGPLCHHFCEQFPSEEAQLAPVRMSLAAIAAAETRDWPGNVRELASAIRGAVLRAHHEGVRAVEPRHLFPDDDTDDAHDPSDTDNPGLDFRASTRRHQRRLLEGALDRARGNKTRACALLGLSRAHFYSLLDQHGLRANTK